MSHVTRYILRQLLGPLAFTTVVLAAVVWLSQSLAFVDMIINRGLSFLRFLYLTLMLAPGFLALILPVALFCSILYTYHRLTYDSEITAMRSSGLNQRALAMPAIMLAVAVTLVGYLFSLYLTPLGFRTFKDLQFVIRSNQASVLLQDGEFNTIGDGITAYIRERGPGGELLGILVHDGRNPAHPVTVMAERGVLLVGDNNAPRFVLFQGNRQEIDQNKDQLSLLYFERYALDLDVLGQSAADRWREPAERFLPSLLFPDNSHDDRRYADELRAEGHNRLTTPLYALVLAVIALGAVLSGEFNRRGEWSRMAVASAAAVVFEAVGLGLVTLIAHQPTLTPLLYLNPLLGLAVGAYALGVRRWRARLLQLLPRPA